VGFAAETYLLSLLLRCGFDAAMTMGTTKAVDLVAIASGGRTITVDVKGACANEDFLLGTRLRERHGHFTPKESYIRESVAGLCGRIRVHPISFPRVLEPTIASFSPPKCAG